MTEQYIKSFWEKVDKDGPIQEHMPHLGKCWLWKAAKEKPFGHGVFSTKKCIPKKIGAHRFSWVLHYGPIPDCLHVLHKCDFPQCTNPNHLFLGTQKDNNDDRIKKGRSASGLKNGAYTKPEKRVRGDKHGMAKLTEPQAVEIKKLLRAGMHPLEVSKKIGTSHASVKFIKYGTTWSHIQ